MCGIFGYIGPRTDGAQLVLEGIKSLEYRGYDSWGVACVVDKKIQVKKKAGKIGNASVADMPKSSLALGHTRWATHGGVTDRNAHPHLDCSGSIAVVHNGIFENYDEVKKRLAKNGHEFASETDTEVISHAIEEYVKQMPFPQAVRRVFNEMDGLSAFIAIKAGERVLVAVRSGSPLVVGYGHGENFIASDPAAILPHSKRVYFLEDGEMALVSNTAIRIFDTKTGSEVKPKIARLAWSPQQAEKGKFPYYMLKEIHEQPDALERIAATSLSYTRRVAAAIKKSYGSYLVGCGSASYAAIAGEYLFSKIAKRHVNSAIGSEFGYHLNFLTPKSAVLAISQSGETMDILEGLKKAKERKAKIYALVNVVGSTLYRLADQSIPIGVGPEKAVASTKALTGMLAHLILLAYTITGDEAKGAGLIKQAADVTRSLLLPRAVKSISALAKKLKTKDHIYVIGRGLSYPTALEWAIKIKEISYIHAEGLAAGELKHGTLALVTRGTPCIVFLPDDETYGANLAGAMEMKARGGSIIGISHKPHEIFDDYIAVDDVGVATIIPNIVVGQLLGYHLAIERGLDPDMPRNLAKSVTVK